MQQVQGITQRQSQRQLLLQSQIEAISLLSLSGEELNAAIRNAVHENPALSFARPPSEAARFKETASVTKEGEEASARFQAAYENVAGEGETLQSHLLFQLDVMHLNRDEAELGKRLIQNLDGNGYHTLDPAALLDKKRPGQNAAMLRRMISMIQAMDPEGTCCNNMEESLLVQARLKGTAAPPLALFILDGHIDALYSNSSTLDTKLILRRLRRLQQERSALSFAAPSLIDIIQLDEDAVKNAVSFISSLNPRPASGFGHEATSFALPDVIITMINGADGGEKAAGSYVEDGIDSGEGIVAAQGARYKVKMASALPKLQLSGEFSAVRGREASLARLRAKSFIANLHWRASLIVKAACLIVEHQSPFFCTGGKAPLEHFTQARLSAILHVATSTVSRMVTSKYIASPWGRLYPMSYFFTNGEAKAKDAIIDIIRSAAPRKGRALSDREIAERLAERGIHIARRTVAKYRCAISIPPSHKRKGDVQDKQAMPPPLEET